MLLQMEEAWQSPPGAAPSPETSYYCPGGRRPRRIHAALELPHGGHLLARSQAVSLGDLLFTALGDSSKAPPIWCGVDSH